MHICHVITRLIIGGAQENTILSCEGLRDLGHEVALIAGPTHGPEGTLVERAKAGGYRFIQLEDLIRAVNPWRDRRARRYLAMEFERLRPDVIHTHSSKAGIIGRLAAQDAVRNVRKSQRIGFLRGVDLERTMQAFSGSGAEPWMPARPTRGNWRPAVVHTIHGMSFNRTQPWAIRTLYSWLERRAARSTDRIVAVADAMVEQSVAAGICPREKLVTIYSGMEVERFDPLLYDRRTIRLGWGVPEDAVVVGTIARLFRRKGYEQLIPSMARAAAADHRLHFVWVGDGAQRPMYEAELARLGLRNRTTLTGLVSPEEIPQLLAGFDLLAHTSQWEGLPRAVVQALLMEVPAVAFDIDGTPEVVQDGVTGRLAALNDEDAFVQALLDLSRDGGVRAMMGKAGRLHCLERFDWRVMVAQLDELYRQLTCPE